MIRDLFYIPQFIGPFGCMHNVDLQSSGLATEPVEVLVLRSSLMDKLMKNDKFLIFFYEETSERLYKMYKTLLARILFTPTEIMAHYILEHSENDMFVYKNIQKLGSHIGISKRGIYDILHRFEDVGYVEKKSIASYEVLDRSGLKMQAEYMQEFMCN